MPLEALPGVTGGFGFEPLDPALQNPLYESGVERRVRFAIRLRGQLLNPRCNIDADCLLAPGIGEGATAQRAASMVEATNAPCFGALRRLHAPCP